MFSRASKKSGRSAAACSWSRSASSKPLLDLEHATEGVVRLGVVGLGRDRALEGAAGRGQAAVLVEHEPELAEQAGVLGLAAQRRLEVADRAGRIAARLEQAREVGVRLREAGVDRERAAPGVERGAGLPEPRVDAAEVEQRPGVSRVVVERREVVGDRLLEPAFAHQPVRPRIGGARGLVLRAPRWLFVRALGRSVGRAGAAPSLALFRATSGWKTGRAPVSIVMRRWISSLLKPSAVGRFTPGSTCTS